MKFLKYFESISNSGIHLISGGIGLPANDIRHEVFKSHTNVNFTKRDILFFKEKFIKGETHDFFLTSDLDKPNRVKVSTNFRRTNSSSHFGEIPKSICLIFYKLGDEYYLCHIKHTTINYLIDALEDVEDFINITVPKIYDVLHIRNGHWDGNYSQLPIN